MAAKPDIDHVTGFETTGHEWDGIKELNKPLPKWWLYVFYATIVWSIGYWVLYPSWPLVSSYTQGMLGYSQRQEVMQSVDTAKLAQERQGETIARATLDEIKADLKLFDIALTGGRAAFGDNCAPCHGRGAQGAKGYPNLNDDDWLWGGSLQEIHQTIASGIADAHEASMPRFGLDGILDRAQIADSAEYVLSLSGKSTNAAAAEKGKAVFAENCVTCHGENGKGNKGVGAPSLADAIWLYGSTKADVARSIETGRGGVMPAWTGRLDADRAARFYGPGVHLLALITTTGWMLAGAGWEFSLLTAIAVLIITCPCALALAVPAVQVAASSRLFSTGVLVKAADGLERISEIDTIVFDKTGTLTHGQPVLLDAAGYDADVLQAAASLAIASHHPYARAVVAAARQRFGQVARIEGIEETPGFGLRLATPAGE